MGIDPCEWYDDVRRLCEQAEDVELTVRQMQRLVLEGDLTRLDVDLERRILYEESLTLHVTLDVNIDTKAQFRK